MAAAARRELELALLEAKLKHASPEAKEAAAQVTHKMYITDNRRESNYVSLLTMLTGRLEETRKALGYARTQQLIIDVERRIASRLDGDGLRPVTEFPSRFDVQTWGEKTDDDDPQAILQEYRRAVHASIRRRREEAEWKKDVLEAKSELPSRLQQPQQQQQQQEDSEVSEGALTEEFDAKEFDRILRGRPPTPSTSTPSEPAAPVRSSSPLLRSRISRSDASAATTLAASSSTFRVRASEPGETRPSSRALVPTLKKSSSQPIPFQRSPSMPRPLPLASAISEPILESPREVHSTLQVVPDVLAGEAAGEAEAHPAHVPAEPDVRPTAPMQMRRVYGVHSQGALSIGPERQREHAQQQQPQLQPQPPRVPRGTRVMRRRSVSEPTAPAPSRPNTAAEASPRPSSQHGQPSQSSQPSQSQPSHYSAHQAAALPPLHKLRLRHSHPGELSRLTPVLTLLGDPQVVAVVASVGARTKMQQSMTGNTWRV